MQHVQGEIKEILSACDGTPTQKLIAILTAAGITASAEVARLIGVTQRAIQKANSSSHERTTVREPQFADANSSSPKANHSSRASRADYINNNPNTKTTSEENSRTRAQGFAGKFIQLPADEVAKLEAAFPKLSFPGDLLAADTFLAGQIAGKIEFSSPDDRKTRVVTYLAKRNRETVERQPAPAKPAFASDMLGGVPFKLDPATPKNLKPRLTGAAHA